MDDNQLHALREAPPPEFADRLRRQLRQQESERASLRTWPLRRLVYGTASLAVVVALLALPQVRTSAQSFLAMFRTVNFVALPVDADRLEMLRSQQLDIPDLIGERLEVVEDPGAPVTMVSVAQAGAAAGIDVREPAFLPAGVMLAGISVKGQQRLRTRADARRLREVMDMLGIRDIEVPDGLDGQVVDVTIPPVVSLVYERDGGRVARLVQATTPDVRLPSGVNLPVLGEIGLRIMGLQPDEARQFAGSIDWQSTLLLPIPPDATEVRHVTIGGGRGLFMHRAANQATRTSRATIIVWSANTRVFGLDGAPGANPGELLTVAQSIQ